MEGLIALVIGGAILGAYFVRRSITRVVAKRLLTLSALGTGVFGLGLFLLLTGRFSLVNPYLWAWTLAVFFLLSLGAAPFGLIPLLLRTDQGAEEHRT